MVSDTGAQRQHNGADIPIKGPDPGEGLPAEVFRRRSFDAPATDRRHFFCKIPKKNSIYDIQLSYIPIYYKALIQAIEEDEKWK